MPVAAEVSSSNVNLIVDESGAEIVLEEDLQELRKQISGSPTSISLISQSTSTERKNKQQKEIGFLPHTDGTTKQPIPPPQCG